MSPEKEMPSGFSFGRSFLLKHAWAPANPQSENRFHFAHHPISRLQVKVPLTRTFGYLTGKSIGIMLKMVANRVSATTTVIEQASSHLHNNPVRHHGDFCLQQVSWRASKQHLGARDASTSHHPRHDWREEPILRSAA